MVAGFTPYQLHQDDFLGFLFFLLLIVSGKRLVGIVLARGRKVIIVFNSLICLTALSRMIWFFLPNFYLEPSYVPIPVQAFEGDWKGVLCSEIVLAVGNMSLYGSFIVIACYWAHILGKLDGTETSHAVDEEQNPVAKKHSGTLAQFGRIMGTILFLEAVNISLFLSGWYSSEGVALADCVGFTLLAGAVAWEMRRYSRRMESAVEKTELLHRSTSQAQVRRIHAMAVLSVGFFVSRVLFELALGLPVLLALCGQRPVAILLFS